MWRRPAISGVFSKQRLVEATTKDQASLGLLSWNLGGSKASTIEELVDEIDDIYGSGAMPGAWGFLALQEAVHEVVESRQPTCRGHVVLRGAASAPCGGRRGLALVFAQRLSHLVGRCVTSEFSFWLKWGA